jgi:hypothetical protein
MQKSVSIEFFVDDVANVARTGELEHQCIDKGDVIGQEKKTAVGQMLQPEGRRPIR